MIQIGNVAVPGRVWLAPMTGVSDLPFRQTAASLGAAYVATEMVACEGFSRVRPEMVRRAAVGEGLPLMVVQLVGRDPRWIAAGARRAAAAGAQIVDLNFGCPAKSVTGSLCGAALMRDLDLAEVLIAAAVDAADIAVTIKIRLGWDDATRNAPELARRAQNAGAKAVTVHGRTRRQFYDGAADWAAVREVVLAVNIPVLVNGDISDATTAREAMAESGAAGVMIGRGAIGRPWIGAQIDAALEGRNLPPPGPERRLEIVLAHLRSSVAFHGPRLGVRMFRKHLAAYIDAAPWPGSTEDRRAARSRLCRLESPAEIADALAGLWTPDDQRLAA